MKKVLFMCVLFTSFAFAQQSETERFVRAINRIIDAVNTGQYNTLITNYNTDMQTALPLDKTTIFFQNLKDQYGKVLRADVPQKVSSSEMTVVLYFEHGMQNLDLYLDNQDKIAGFVVTTYTLPEKPQADAAVPPTTAPAAAPAQSASTPPPVPAVTDKQLTVLLLPFKDSWLVYEGGTDTDGAAHILKQRYAFTFCAFSTAGERYKNKGEHKEDYTGYGKDILAPADGTVVCAIDGIPDNEPGKRNPYALIGNAVFIQHASGEVSVLAYLKQGSIKVKPGQKVSQGQILAQCGSSGGATEPSLHYHLQSTTSLLTAKQVKYYFEHAAVTKEGKKELKTIYLPVMGDVVSPE